MIVRFWGYDKTLFAGISIRINNLPLTNDLEKQVFLPVCN